MFVDVSFLMTIIFLLLGFVFLVKGADLLVDGASSLAKRFHISDLVIGLTIVAFGTSAPELIVNIIASINGNSEIAIGNILGSNIANIFLILGVASLISPLRVTHGTVWKEIPFGLLAALVLGVAASDTLIEGTAFSGLSRIDGLLFLGFFIIFLYYAFSIARNEPDFEGEANSLPLWRTFLYLFAGLGALTLGGKWVVDSSVALAQALEMSQTFIGLTIVAIGTSLPELATSALAAYKNKADIAVGNVVGSNIFNIFFVLGISATIRPLPFLERNLLDLGVVLLASLILFAFMFVWKKHHLVKKEGGIFIFLYASYIASLIYLG